MIRWSGIGAAFALMVALPSPLLAAAPPAAAPDQAEAAALLRTDTFARRLAAEDRFSGVILIARGGAPLLLRSYGLADRAHQAPVTADTSFHLASAGKMFTATAILQLAAEGRLSLDDKVGKLLPDYPNKEVAEKVTVRHLLTHSGGTGDIDVLDPAKAQQTAFVRGHADIVTLHGTRAPTFEPGSSMEYSNYGFILLGRIVERLSGQPYWDYVRRRIFEPAGMRRAGFPLRGAHPPHLATGYTERWPDPERISPMQPNTPTLPWRGTAAGGGTASALDMLRFVDALQSGRLIPPELFAEQIKPQLQASGLGTWLAGEGARSHWGHGGGAWGMNVEVRNFPQTGHAVIVMANRDPPAATTIANAFDYFRFDPDGRTPIFLRGTMNEWSTATPVKRGEGGIYSVDLPLDAGEHSFKLASEDWASVDLGVLTPDKVSEGTANHPLALQGANIPLVVSRKGVFRFTLSGLAEGKPVLSVTRVSD